MNPKVALVTLPSTFVAMIHTTEDEPLTSILAKAKQQEAEAIKEGYLLFKEFFGVPTITLEAVDYN